MTENRTLNPALAQFAEELQQAEASHRGLILDLERALNALADDSELEDYLYDCLDELKSDLGAQAANKVGDDQAAQEAAIEAVETWLADNVSNEGLVTRIAAAILSKGLNDVETNLRALLPQPEKVQLRLTLDVTYDLNGENATEMVSRLRKMCERAIGEGMLTGSSDAEVDEYSMDVEIMPEVLPKEAIADLMLQRIESGDLALEDIPDRLAQYGLMEPQAFLAEMRERLEHHASDSAELHKRVYSVDVVLDSGAIFNWAGTANNRQQAIEKASHDAELLTGETFHMVKTVTVG